MGKNTRIQYADHTQNFWQGCTKVSPGCKYCYMYREKERWGQNPFKVVRSQQATFNAPLHITEPSTIFTCSWSDFFIAEADPWRAEAWAIIRQTPQHIYQIFTKRPERVAACLPEDWGEGYKNVIIIVSMENQEWFDRRIGYLAHIQGCIRGISMEPLIGPIHIDEKYKDLIDWVIVGGESGFGQVPEQTGIKYGFRRCDESWIIDIIDNCQQLGIPVFVKQLGTYLAKKYKLSDYHGGTPDEWTEWPLQSLKVFEYPVGYEPKKSTG